MDSAPVARRCPGLWPAVRILLGILLAVVFLALAFRKVDADQVRDVVRRADVALLLAALAVGSANLLLRAARWRLLLAAGGRVPLGLAFWVMSVGYLGNTLLPMRTGDLGRSYLMGRRAGMGGSFALATTVAERVLDAGFLVIVGGLSLLGHPLAPGWLSRGLILLAAISGIALALLLSLPRFWERIAWRLESLPRFSRAFRRLRQHWLDRFVEGLASIRHAGRMAQFLLLTSILWLVDGATTMLVSRALGIPLPMTGALVLLAALGASSAVPLTPGQIGVYQWVASSVLASYGVAPEPAVVTSVALQAMNYLVLLAWGTVGVFKLGGPEILRGLGRRGQVAADGTPASTAGDP